MWPRSQLVAVASKLPGICEGWLRGSAPLEIGIKQERFEHIALTEFYNNQKQAGQATGGGVLVRSQKAGYFDEGIKGKLSIGGIKAPCGEGTHWQYVLRPVQGRWSSKVCEIDNN